MFIECIIEGVEHEEEFDFLYLVCSTMSFIFAKDVDDGHESILLCVLLSE